MNKFIQKEFIKFHDRIKLTNFDNDRKLRQKRDMLLEEIRNYLTKKYKDSDEKKPTFYHLNQGSYAMRTGIEPTHSEDDYDIDVGLVFNVSTDDWQPVVLKELVKEALERQHNRDVEMKRPCVRVQYWKNGKKDYHIDLALYANNDGQLYLAKGYKGSDKAYKIWEPADPERLKQLIQDRFEDKVERAQFRRVIRYMKRWKDVTFKSSGHARPTGIALTILAYEHFEPKVDCQCLEGEKSNDLCALISFVKKVLNQFSYWPRYLTVELPVQPYNDLFERMSDQQLCTFKCKLQELQEALEDAKEQSDLAEACRILQKVFGEDFEIPSHSFAY